MKRFVKACLSLRASLLADENIRFIVTRSRYWFLKRNIKVLKGFDQYPSVRYNMNFNPAAFGCGGRMSILLFPLRGFLFPGHQSAKVLVVGPRTEDDIFWARSIGLTNTRGLDLFSYSPLIDLGDAHQTSYPAGQFDAIVLGWILPYIEHPQQVLREMCRIAKVGGIIGVAWHFVSDRGASRNIFTQHSINEISDVQALVEGAGGQVFCIVDTGNDDTDHNKVIFFKVVK